MTDEYDDYLEDIPETIAKRLIREVLDTVRPTAVTFRTVGINFDERWVSFDGVRHQVDTVGVDFPILSGEIVLWPRR